MKTTRLFAWLEGQSIRTHLMLLVIFAVLPALAAILYSGLEQRRNEIDRARQDCLTVVNTLAQEEGRVVSAARQLLTTLAQFPELKARNAKACAGLFKTLLNQNPELSALSAAGPDGIVYAGGQPAFEPFSIADRKYFKDLLRTKTFASGEYAVSRISGKPTIHFAMPVIDDQGRFQGSVQVGLELNRFGDFLKQARPFENTILVVTDHAGKVLHHSREQAKFEGQDDDPGIFTHIRQCQGRCPVIEDLEQDGREVVIACAALRVSEDSEPYMYLRVGIPKSEVHAKVRLATLHSLGLLGLATLTALGIAGLLAEARIVWPVRRLVEASHRMAAGDLSARAGGDGYIGELGRLARSFDAMGQALAEREQERDRALDELRPMQYAIDHVALPITWADRTGTRVYVNNEFCRLLGCNREELVGHKMWEINRHFDLEKWAQRWEILKKNGALHLEGHFNTKDGEERQCEVNASYIQFGEREFVMSFLRDITADKQAEERLRQSQKMEAIGTLAGGIAHDFNNLLTGILGYANLLSMSAEPGSSVHESATVIEKAAERAADLTRQLLGFARKGKFLDVAFKLQPLISESIGLLERTLDKNITVTQRLRTPQATVQGDPNQIQQVVMNLVLNARDAMAGGGQLTIETEQVELDEDYCQSHPQAVPGRYVVIAVSDTGDGIPKEIQDRIFEPFFTTKDSGKGSGMGLAMVYGIVKNHNGSIQLYSEPGEGARFNIYLPLAEDPADTRSRRHAPAAPAHGNGLVMLVDDEVIPRNLAQSMLERLGYDVLTFGSGADAVAFYRRQWPAIDLVILDMIMPGMDGQECFQALRAVNPSVRAILSSGYSREGRAQSILDEGMVGFIQKPYRIDELAAIVSAALKADVA